MTRGSFSPSAVWNYGTTVEGIEVPLRIWAARRTVTMHCELPPLGGRCKACPDDDADVCPAFRCAIRVLVDHAGIPYLYRLT